MDTRNSGADKKDDPDRLLCAVSSVGAQQHGEARAVAHRAPKREVGAHALTGQTKVDATQISRAILWRSVLGVEVERVAGGVRDTLPGARWAVARTDGNQEVALRRIARRDSDL